jgi:hypothetical protein
MTLHILKVGGKVIDDLALLRPILEAFLEKEGKKKVQLDDITGEGRENYVGKAKKRNLSL